MTDETTADKPRRRFASSRMAVLILVVTALAVPTIYFGTSRLDGVSTRSSRTASIGTIAPAIALPQADGSTWELASARKNGPVVLVFLRGFF